jgi:hypothetical protein
VPGSKYRSCAAPLVPTAMPVINIPTPTIFMATTLPPVRPRRDDGIRGAFLFCESANVAKRFRVLCPAEFGVR